jgi:transcription antitermination factor NusG
MQKKWYVFYTRPNYERKVAQLLSKKKIETFCPLRRTKINSLRRIKRQDEPLFKEYLFVNLSDKDMIVARKATGVINFIYWMGEPAVIKHEEILAIKEFCNDYTEIELFKTPVNVNETARFIDSPTYNNDGNILSIKNKSIKIILPSLGYVMVATLKEESIFASETTILQANSFSNS